MKPKSMPCCTQAALLGVLDGLACLVSVKSQVSRALGSQQAAFLGVLDGLACLLLRLHPPPLPQVPAASPPAPASTAPSASCCSPT